MADIPHSIELSVGDLSLAVSGSQDFVEKQFYELYESHGFDSLDASKADIEVGVEGSHANEPSGGEDTEPEIEASLNELLSDSEISMVQDKALAVGWYLIAARGQDDMTWDEVEEEADRSQVELGKKVRRDLRSNVQKGHLGPTGEKRDDSETYEVTESGKEYLREKGIPT